MTSKRRSASDLDQRREILIARAELERAALRGATEDLQVASDRVARIAIAGVAMVRRYWLPVGIVAAATLFRRTRPVLRAARAGLAIVQTVRLLQAMRR